MLPGPNSVHEEFSWRSVTPICQEIKPFDLHVEGLSRCGDRTFAIQVVVLWSLAKLLGLDQFGLQGLARFEPLWNSETQ